MKLKTFFEEFDQFADAPDAVIFSANGAIHTSLGPRPRKGIPTNIRALKGRHNPDATNAGATTLAPLPGCVIRRAGDPVVSLRSTTGYRLESLRDGRCEFTESDLATDHHIPFLRSPSIRSSDARGIVACSRWLSPRMRATPPDPRPRAIHSSDAGDIPACSRWLSPQPRATPPEIRPPFFRTPAGVPAIATP